jgi:hypothetical protein
LDAARNREVPSQTGMFRIISNISSKMNKVKEPLFDLKSTGSRLKQVFRLRKD